MLDIWKYYKCKDIWFRFEAGEKTTGIPIHILRNKVGDHLSSSIIKTYVLPGCDVTSKTITKSSAMKNNQESFLDDFGIREPFNAAFESRDKFLVNVIWPSSNYKRFDKLRQEKWRLLTKSIWTATNILLISHFRRSHCFFDFCTLNNNFFITTTQYIHY